MMATSQYDSNSLAVISAPRHATLDIIVVHGMNVWGSKLHAENTWTHDQTKVNWVRSLLPDAVPLARILAFQYNANVAFGRSVAGVESQARNLLEGLRYKRKVNPVRPIIFVSHSLGGIIVKEALALAFREYDTFPMIWNFTYAIFFLAVPHHGSDHAPLGEMAVKLLDFASLEPSNSLLAALEPGTPYNKSLNARFEPLHNAYKFYTWSEGMPLGPLGIIVPMKSACMGISQEKHRRVMNRDHRSICKFYGRNDPNWHELRDVIVEAAAAATKCCHYSPTMQNRAPLLATPVIQDKEPLESIGLIAACNSVEATISRLNDFRNGKELRVKEGEVADAKASLLTLASLCYAIVLPIMRLLVFLTPADVLGLSMAWSALLLTLPSKEEALAQAGRSQDAEQVVMDTEAWAIQRLNEHLCEAIEALHVLSRAIRVHEHENMVPGLSRARDIERQLQMGIIFITEDLHRRHGLFNKAEAVWNKIEHARAEVADKEGRDFWTATAEMVQDEEEEDEDDDCCRVQ